MPDLRGGRRQTDRGPLLNRQRPPRDRTPPQPVAGTITDLSEQKRDPERVNVIIDGAFAFGLSADLVLEAGLAKGVTLTLAESADLLARDEVRQATTAAIRLLGHRARSERELRQRLRQKGFNGPAIDQAITRLRDWHYLDDEDFARRWVEGRQEHQPRSERLLTLELRQKGVDKETIDEVIADAEVDEQADALALARRKAGSYRGLEPDVQRRRLAAFLARRGYSYDVIRPVLDEVLAPDEDEFE